MKTGGGGSKNLLVRSVGGARLLLIRDISYIEVRQHYLFYHVRENGAETVIQTRGTIQDAEKQLSGHDFVRCSISYLVNLNHVTSIIGNDVYLEQTILSISRNQKTAFTEAFMRFLSARKVVMR